MFPDLDPYFFPISFAPGIGAGNDALATLHIVGDINPVINKTDTTFFIFTSIFSFIISLTQQFKQDIRVLFELLIVYYNNIKIKGVIYNEKKDNYFDYNYYVNANSTI